MFVETTTWSCKPWRNAICAAAAMISFVSGDALAKPMSFTLERTDAREAGLDLWQLVYADGEIMPDTADKLQEFAEANDLIPGAYVYFNSPGGSVGGGIKLGEAIRQLGFSTDVGRKLAPGECLSACAYAYLGGRYRYMQDDDVYGVHRFYGDVDGDTAQIVSGLLTSYIERMGAKPGLFSLMTLKGGDDMLAIPLPVLTELNVVNNGVEATTWTIENAEAAGFYLKGVAQTDRGEQKLMFLCHDGQLFGMPMLESPDTDFVVKNTGKINWIVDDDWLPPLPPEEGLPEASNGHVSTVVPIAAALYKRLVQSKVAGFAWRHVNEQIFAGFKISMADGSAKLKSFGRTCNSKVYL